MKRCGRCGAEMERGEGTLACRMDACAHQAIFLICRPCRIAHDLWWSGERIAIKDSDEITITPPKTEETA